MSYGHGPDICATIDKWKAQLHREVYTPMLENHPCKFPDDDEGGPCETHGTSLCHISPILGPSDTIKDEDTKQNIGNVERIWIDDNRVLHCVGRDSNWNQWNVPRSSVMYAAYLGLLGKADSNGLVPR